MVDQRGIGSQQFGREFFLVVRRLPLHEFEWQAIREKTLPVVFAELAAILIEGIHDPLVVEPQALEDRDGPVQFEIVEQRQVRQPVPVGLLRDEVRGSEVPHRLANQVMHAASVLALAEQVHQPPGVQATGLPQDRFDGPIGEATRLDILDHSPARREPEFKRMARCQLREQGIERADLHAMQLLRDPLQERDALVASDGRLPDERLELGEFLLIEDRFRQPHEDAVEDFTRSFTRKRRGQNAIATSFAKECEIAIGELKCFAGSGGSQDDDMRVGEGHDRARGLVAVHRFSGFRRLGQSGFLLAPRDKWSGVLEQQFIIGSHTITSRSSTPS